MIDGLVNISGLELNSLIHVIRGVPVILDSDLAFLYHVETKVFNQSVKRNVERFPDTFRFQLTQDEFENLRSQIVTSNQCLSEDCKKRGGRRYLPFAFSEQGVAMLSGVLKSDFAIRTSIRIMEAFVRMRHYISANAQLYSRIDTIERRQIADQCENDKKFEKIFHALDVKQPKMQGIFFDGQIYDAYSFVSGIIEKAEREIILIDGYVDRSVLDMLSKKKKAVNVTIVTYPQTTLTHVDLKKFNAQYPELTLKQTKIFHDRFLIIDQCELYHIGASLKDLGSRCFGFSKMDPCMIPLIVQKL